MNLIFRLRIPTKVPKLETQGRLQGREPNRMVGEITQSNREAVESLKSRLQRFLEENPAKTVLNSSTPMRQTETATRSGDAVIGDTSASQSSPLMFTVPERRVKFK